MSFERIQALAFRTVSQTGINYRNSPLSEALGGLPDGAPRAGDRFPWLRLKLRADGPVQDLFAALDDTRFNLIVIGQPSPVDGGAALGDLVRTHVLPADPVNDAELARVHIAQPSFYLLRPDGHVGLCGTRLEAGAVTRYLSDRLHFARQSRDVAAQTLA